MHIQGWHGLRDVPLEKEASFKTTCLFLPQKNHIYISTPVKVWGKDKAETMIAFWRVKQVARKYVSWSRKKSVLGRNQKCKMPQVCMMILPTVKCLSKARMGKPRVVFGLCSHARPSDTNPTRPFRHNQGKKIAWKAEKAHLWRFMNKSRYVTV